MEPEEIQAMIDQSIAKAMYHHTRDVSIISFIAGIVILGFYTHGVLALVENMK